MAPIEPQQPTMFSFYSLIQARVCEKRKKEGEIYFAFLPVKWPRQESNLNLELRKLLYYPLYYVAGYSRCKGKSFYRVFRRQRSLFQLH